MSFNIDELKVTRSPNDPRLQFTMELLANKTSPLPPGGVPSLLMDPTQNLLMWNLDAPENCQNRVISPVNFSFFNSGACDAKIRTNLQNGLFYLRGGVVFSEPKGPPPRKNNRVTSDLQVKEMKWTRVTGYNYQVKADFNHDPASVYSYQPLNYQLQTSPVDGKQYLVYFVQRTENPKTDVMFPQNIIINASAFNEMYRLEIILWDIFDGMVVDWTQPLDSFSQIHFTQV